MEEKGKRWRKKEKWERNELNLKEIKRLGEWRSERIEKMNGGKRVESGERGGMNG